MVLIKKILVAFLSLTLSSCMHKNVIETCNPIQGKKLISEGQYEEALTRLRVCEFEDEISGYALMQLYLLYGWFNLGEFKSERARVRKLYSLVVRAAKKNEESAVTELVNMYETGLPSIKLGPNPQIVSCLEQTFQTKAINAVERCL